MLPTEARREVDVKKPQILVHFMSHLMVNCPPTDSGFSALWPRWGLRGRAWAWGAVGRPPGTGSRVVAVSMLICVPAMLGAGVKTGWIPDRRMRSVEVGSARFEGSQGGPGAGALRAAA